MSYREHPLMLLEPEDRRAIVLKAFKDAEFLIKHTAARLNITPVTLYRWVKKDEELRLAMKRAVRDSLLTAYEVDESTTQSMEKSAEDVNVAKPVQNSRSAPVHYAGIAPRGSTRIRDGWE